MSEPIEEASYWKLRLQKALQRGELHHSIFLCDSKKWNSIGASHKLALLELIKPGDSILDAGCGYGRLLGLMPSNWTGTYTGIDVSPDLLQLARTAHPGREFLLGNIQDTKELTNRVYDWCILISIRPMIKRNIGSDYWDQLEETLSLCSRQLLFLEYEEGNKPEIKKGSV